MTNLIITVDTEGDNAWDINSVGSCTENAKYLPRFQQLCERFGFKPTYLTSYEMAMDGFFTKFASDCQRRNACEIGLHPHPWNMPPEYKITSNDLLYKPYMIEYPEHIMRRKINILHDILCDKFGCRIVSHRAGRWSFNSTYAKILVEFGYKVDCSVVPHAKNILNRAFDKEPCMAYLPDYTKFSDKPYFIDQNDIAKEGNLPLLELPMTIIPNYGKLKNLIYNHIPLDIGKLIFRFFFGTPLLWFRPTQHNADNFHKAAILTLKRQADYIMFMIHSSELMPNGSPNFKTPQDIEALYKNMELVFQWLKKNHVSGLSCAEYYERYINEQD